MNLLMIEGASPEAQYASSMIRKQRQYMGTSNSLGVPAAIDELVSVWNECRLPNWDGAGALPIELDTFRQAKWFLECLPLGTRSPSAGAEPDGQLTLEWYRSKRRTLSVSITPDGELYYAALLGHTRRYGTEPFFGEIPRSILDLIHEVFAA